MSINCESKGPIPFVVLLCFLGLVSSGCHSTAARSVQVSELTVVDQQDNVLIRLDEQGGNGAITLYDQSGQMLVSLVARPAMYDVPAGGELSLWRPDEMLLFAVYPSQNGSGISLYSPGKDGERRWGQPSVIIETTDSGEPRIRTENGLLRIEQLEPPD